MVDLATLADSLAVHFGISLALDETSEVVMKYGRKGQYSLLFSQEESDISLYFAHHFSDEGSEGVYLRLVQSRVGDFSSLLYKTDNVSRSARKFAPFRCDNRKNLEGRFIRTLADELANASPSEVVVPVDIAITEIKDAASIIKKYFLDDYVAPHLQK